MSHGNQNKWNWIRVALRKAEEEAYLLLTLNWGSKEPVWNTLVDSEFTEGLITPGSTIHLPILGNGIHCAPGDSTVIDCL